VQSRAVEAGAVRRAIPLPAGFTPYVWALRTDELAARHGLRPEQIVRFDQNKCVITLDYSCGFTDRGNVFLFGIDLENVFHQWTVLSGLTRGLRDRTSQNETPSIRGPKRVKCLFQIDAIEN